MIDVLYYHVVNQSIILSNNTMVFNTLLTNSTVDKLGYGLPLFQASNGTSDNGASNNSTIGDGQTNDTTSSIWTVGTGTENDASFATNQSIQGSNGIAYIIDKILVPPENPNQTLNELANASLFDSLLGQFSGDSLDTSSNITLFVPVNQALQNINNTSLDSQTSSQIVLAHVVPGIYYSTNLTSQPTTVTSLAGTNISITNANDSSDNNMQVNGFNVVHPNVLLNNGVMHLIDGVLDYVSSQPMGNNTNGNSTGVAGSTSSVIDTSTGMSASSTSAAGVTTSGTS
ncbi:FAS1 domain-containing protein, partial [Choanephora cucurbitarum]